MVQDNFWTVFGNGFPTMQNRLLHICWSTREFGDLHRLICRRHVHRCKDIGGDKSDFRQIVQKVLAKISRKVNLCWAFKSITTESNVQWKSVKLQASIKWSKSFNQVDAKLVRNPNVQGQPLSTIEKEDERMKFRPYHSLVGSLLYSSNGTRPDIAFSVGQLGRHLERPSEEHWKAAVRILRYLKSTSDIGIDYTGTVKELCVCAYSDADWANNKESRRSVSGMMVMMNFADGSDKCTPLILKPEI